MAQVHGMEVFEFKSHSKSKKRVLLNVVDCWTVSSKASTLTSSTSAKAARPTTASPLQSSLLSSCSSSLTSSTTNNNKKNRQSDTPSHALVFWLNENKTTVVSITDIQSNGRVVNEGEIYPVKFGRISTKCPNPFYEAKILAIGNRDVCKLAEKSRGLASLDIPSTQTASNNSQSKLSSHEEEATSKALKVAEKKLKEMEVVLRAQEDKYGKLEREYEALQKKHTDFLDSFKPEDKDKYLRMAKHTLALFGNQSEVVESQLVPLSQQYPMVTVQPMVVRDLTAMLQSAKENSYVFRKVMPILIPELSDWTGSEGAKDLLDKFNVEISAAYGTLF